MKLLMTIQLKIKVNVAPLVGAWIEISGKRIVYDKEVVAPLVGAWIEILLQVKHHRRNMSLLL